MVIVIVMVMVMVLLNMMMNTLEMVNTLVMVMVMANTLVMLMTVLLIHRFRYFGDNFSFLECLVMCLDHMIFDIFGWYDIRCLIDMMDKLLMINIDNLVWY